MSASFCKSDLLPENVITSAVGKTGKKIHKRVNIDGGNFFIELKTTKE